MREIFRRIFLAFRVFFATLFYGSIAEQVARIFGGGGPAATPAPRPAKTAAARRNRPFAARR